MTLHSFVRRAFVLSIATACMPTHADIPTGERNALLALYASTNGGELGQQFRLEWGRWQRMHLVRRAVFVRRHDARHRNSP